MSPGEEEEEDEDVYTGHYLMKSKHLSTGPSASLQEEEEEEEEELNIQSWRLVRTAVAAILSQHLSVTLSKVIWFSSTSVQSSIIQIIVANSISITPSDRETWAVCVCVCVHGQVWRSGRGTNKMD